MSTDKGQQLPDFDLVERILGGNRQAFEMLISCTESLVAQMIFKMIPNTGDRKDIAQEVYLKIYKGLPGFKFHSKLSTWIGQITYNTCLHYLEKKRLVLLPPVNDESGNDPVEVMMQRGQDIHTNETEARLDSRELKAILDTALQRLIPIYQVLIGLYYQQNLSLNEIAVITSLPEGTIKSYLYRARKQLKENILSKYKREEL